MTSHKGVNVLIKTATQPPPIPTVRPEYSLNEVIRTRQVGIGQDKQGRLVQGSKGQHMIGQDKAG